MTMDDNERVGYGKPPRRHQFKPGTSGNRNGRPKLSSAPINDFRDAEAARLISVGCANGKVKKITKAEMAAHALVNRALSGDMSAVAEVLNLEKKLAQAGMFDRPIHITVELVGGP
jgi:hypothetical protein